MTTKCSVSVVYFLRFDKNICLQGKTQKHHNLKFVLNTIAKAQTHHISCKQTIVLLIILYIIPSFALSLLFSFYCPFFHTECIKFLFQRYFKNTTIVISLTILTIFILSTSLYKHMSLCIIALNAYYSSNAMNFLASSSFLPTHN